MFFVEIFLLLNFTVLCGILVVLWQIRDHLLKKEELPAKRDSSAS